MTTLFGFERKNTPPARYVDQCDVCRQVCQQYWYIPLHRTMYSVLFICTNCHGMALGLMYKHGSTVSIDEI